MPPTLRPETGDQQLPETSVGEHLAVGAQPLLEDLAAVGDEQQAGPASGLGGEVLVVERGDDRLAGAGGGHQQVAVPLVHLTFGLERLQHLLLMRPGTHSQARDGQRPGLAVASRGLVEGAVEPLAVGRGVGLERRVVPVAVEGRRELAQQFGCGGRGDPHVPLHPVEHRRTRQVGRADVGRVEAGVAHEPPRLGVQPGALGLVADAHLRPVLVDQPVEGGPLGGAQVGAGDDAQLDATFAQRGQRLLQRPDAVPLDERAEQLDPVGRPQLGRDLAAHRGLAAGVGEQGRLRQRGLGGREVPGRTPGAGRVQQRQQSPRVAVDQLVGRAEALHDVVGERPGLRLGDVEGLQRNLPDVPGEHLGQLRAVDCRFLGHQPGRVHAPAQPSGDQRVVVALDSRDVRHVPLSPPAPGEPARRCATPAAPAPRAAPPRPDAGRRAPPGGPCVPRGAPARTRPRPDGRPARP